MMEKCKRHIMNLKSPIRNLLKFLEWETVDQVLTAGVWSLRKNKQDPPFDDRINVARCYLSSQREAQVPCSTSRSGNQG